MVTVYRAGGFAFVIFVNDHEPAHIHVFDDGQIKISLNSANGGPELVWADGMKRGDIRRAMRIAEQRQGYLLSRWREIHG